ncbi:15422_t:CDS:2, partial [Dentiscutata heterogama]
DFPITEVFVKRNFVQNNSELSSTEITEENYDTQVLVERKLNQNPEIKSSSETMVTPITRKVLVESNLNINSSKPTTAMSKDWLDIINVLCNSKSLINGKRNTISTDNVRTLNNLDFTKRIFDFCDKAESIEIIQKEFKTWTDLDKITDNVQTEIKVYKLVYYTKLLNGYASLFRFVNKEPKEDDMNYTFKEKFEKGIPLGLNASIPAKKKWVKHQVKKYLNLQVDKSETRIWKSLCRILFIVKKEITSIRELAIAGVMPRKIQSITDVEFKLFLRKISNGQIEKFVPYEIDTIDSDLFGVDLEYNFVQKFVPKEIVTIDSGIELEYNFVYDK